MVDLINALNNNPNLYLFVLVISLGFMLLIVFLIFLMIPNYIKRMRRALLTEKELKNDEQDTKKYLKEYMDIYKNPQTQIYANVIKDEDNKKEEIQFIEKPTNVQSGSANNELNKTEEPIVQRQEIIQTEHKEIQYPSNPDMNKEPHLNIAHNDTKIREVYGSKRFYMNDGIFISSLTQLVVILENIDVETFNRHVNNSKNDFYNWIYNTFDEKQLAEKIKDIRNKKEMADIIKDHLLTN